MSKKKTVAVVFGGSSPEHDVSVVSAQQFMDAMDQRKYKVVPVYLDFENSFYTGTNLRNTNLFRPFPKGLKKISFDWGDDGPSYKIAGFEEENRLDCVVPICHGAFGEDGRLQAYFELIGVPVAGFISSNAAFAMRKDVTKLIVKESGVNILPHVVVKSCQNLNLNSILKDIKSTLGFPVVIKPASLGSSIGVGIAKDEAEFRELISKTFRKDKVVIVEPKVENLVEYNISVACRDEDVVFSAIERPKTSLELLDFKEKYLTGGGGTKGEFKPSEGMLSLTREINPNIPSKIAESLYEFARNSFRALGMRGAPRIDFLCDEKRQEIWFNEINTIPGSYGYFLWEASPKSPMLFPELIDHLIEEAIYSNFKSFDDPVPQEAYLLPR
ncbi:D-alanine--D-alanine ligase [Pseudoalteromonas piscicida]|uniref:ATP-binding protein n=1 Tax=Pseudoalteromonas piscicida TaxID=43662 RepID=UPI000E35DBC9|nr:D-alanine--D-alanine ligase [Pseudoalteromonas piscicida]AXQ99465.1 D-alanine--D-alanine ligase [Pseudoalteromonas piscicida]